MVTAAPLIPAQAGIQFSKIDAAAIYRWVPAYAGTSGI
jgi:hypothetical protein